MSASQGYSHEERADHFQRIVAAIVAKVGPVVLTEAEYAAARAGEISFVFAARVDIDPETPAADREPMAMVLPEHITDSGIATAEDRLAEVLAGHADADPVDQARAVLTALGLPIKNRLPGGEQ